MGDQIKIGIVILSAAKDLLLIFFDSI